MITADPSWTYLAFFLTLLVIIGFLFGEKNFLFRLATYTLVGLTSGIAVIIVIFQVLIPRLLWPVTSGTGPDAGFILIPIILSLLLFAKLSHRMNRLGNLSTALLVGVGGAVLIGGALTGTIFPQLRAVMANFSPARAATAGISFQMSLLDGVFMLFGTISSLAFFHFGARSRSNRPVTRPVPVEILAWFGKIFIAIALGALFAGVFIAALSSLVERLGFLWNVIRSLQL
jgi:hypothetical protein